MFFFQDEYDDTYDDVAVGQEEPDSRDDGGRQFVLPVALGGGKIARVVQERDDEDEADDDVEEGGVGRKHMNFARNPEEIRQENERRRQEKINRNARKPVQLQQPQHQPARDVVGKPIGQGQDKQVLINRARKNANKGKGHRAQAERKQSKGMF